MPPASLRRVRARVRQGVERCNWVVSIYMHVYRLVITTPCLGRVLAESGEDGVRNVAEAHSGTRSPPTDPTPPLGKNYTRCVRSHHNRELLTLVAWWRKAARTASELSQRHEASRRNWVSPRRRGGASFAASDAASLFQQGCPVVHYLGGWGCQLVR